MEAPICRNGVASRSIGRRVREASPWSCVSNGCPASKPESSRIVVPELPQSRGACAGSEARQTDAPHLGAMALARGLERDLGPERGQGAGRRDIVTTAPDPVDDDRPLAQRAEQQRPVGDRLVTRDAASAAEGWRPARAQLGRR